MPFIVTTKRPAICGSCSRTFKDTGDAVGHLEAGPRHDGWFHSCHGTVTQAISRHAVATLEEARHAVRETICAISGCGSSFASSDPSGQPWPTRDMGESGGSVGPLPDGTVIEVAQTSEGDLDHAIGLNPGGRILAEMTTGAIIDAFNARGAE